MESVKSANAPSEKTKTITSQLEVLEEIISFLELCIIFENCKPDITRFPPKTLPWPPTHLKSSLSALAPAALPRSLTRPPRPHPLRARAKPLPAPGFCRPSSPLVCALPLPGALSYPLGQHCKEACSWPLPNALPSLLTDAPIPLPCLLSRHEWHL